MTKLILASLAFLGLICLVTITTTVHAQSQKKWVVQMCYLNACISDTLNSLPPESAATAKLTTWQDKTYVWYLR